LRNGGLLGVDRFQHASDVGDLALRHVGEHVSVGGNYASPPLRDRKELGGSFDQTETSGAVQRAAGTFRRRSDQADLVALRNITATWKNPPIAWHVTRLSSRYSSQTVSY